MPIPKMKPPEYYHQLAHDATNCDCCKNCIVSMTCNQICSRWLDESVTKSIARSGKNLTLNDVYREVKAYADKNNIPYK